MIVWNGWLMQRFVLFLSISGFHTENANGEGAPHFGGRETFSNESRCTREVQAVRTALSLALATEAEKSVSLLFFLYKRNDHVRPAHIRGNQITIPHGTALLANLQGQLTHLWRGVDTISGGDSRAILAWWTNESKWTSADELMDGRWGLYFCDY